MQIARHALAAFLVGVAAGMTPSAAEEVRRLGLSEVITDSTREGIPLDELIRIRIGDTQLRVPAGFIAPWPKSKMRNVLNDWQGISFNFWMPERRYVEINDLSLTNFRPKESGRDPSSGVPFVVKVRPLRPMKPTELGTLSPELRFKNLTSWPSQASYSFKEESFGLVHFWRNDGPEAFIFYKHIDGTDPQILLKCTPFSRTPANPLCDGVVYSAAEELSLNVYFSRGDVGRWRESVEAAIDLFKSWKAAAQ